MPEGHVIEALTASTVDSGLAGPRTALGWQRTTLSAMALAATSAHSLWNGASLTTVLALAAPLALALWLAWRVLRRRRSISGDVGRNAAALAALTLVTVATQIVAWV
ncbi:hypothetical protein [Rhodococcus sp. NCIMB 12038]|uniref:hypothetical protein n=1 Tax=Rhodococcus sp. NCIMB 12038 TaxID=933800 RepID=UPI00117B455A|nr:hypothetical protein [Rhodococcus sp. NCIMB 12038]